MHFFKVHQISKILNKNQETVRRYIREGLKDDASKMLANKNLDKTSRQATAISNSMDNLLKEENKNVIALCVKDTDAKNYEVSQESLLLLLQRKYNMDEKEAAVYLERRINEIKESSKNSKSTNNYQRDEPSGLPTPILNDKAINLSTAEQTKTSLHIDIENYALPCKISDVFKSPEDKSKFIIGLYMLQTIDGIISLEEKKMIANRAARLGITENEVNNLVPEPNNINIEELLTQIKFNSPYQIAVFLLEAIHLGWQDGDYSMEERLLVRRFAATNGISENIVNEYEDKVFKNITASLVSEYLHELK